ncbi:hypothetical protein IQ266_22305 [filamentous cyanobacterium LEGE 11480]|uniref:Uncharacterized protein n=1 Tax=Romeriopsis navalis LEGE 11480 TaxID=2777977 RepID=A0A928VUI0_9CYAN|nr:hypothetical protein [Romeriopsis navalis]MBE9032474.1 hypothetical protein [Romeriopsis navalis LEGE 11480]
MTTQNLHLAPTAKSDKSSALAIFFFLMGAPHIYSVLQQRRRQRDQLLAQLSTPKSLFLMGLAPAGGIAFLAFA